MSFAQAQGFRLGGGIRPSKPKKDDAEFDITAMIDLVFMMNIYFMVTALASAMGEMDLPPSERAVAADRDGAVIITMTLSPDGKSSNVFLGETERGAAVPKGNVDSIIQQAVTTMLEQGKKTVLIKAEKRIPHEDVARVARAASEGGDVQVYFAVVESSAP